MRGQVFKRKESDRTWTIKVSLGYDPATKRYGQHWESVPGTKKDAEKRLSEILHALDTGSYMKPGKTTLADFLDRWLVEYAQANLSAKTAEGYEHIFRKHIIPALGNLTLAQIKPEHLQRYYSDRLNGGLSAQTVRHHHTVLHKALQTALKWGLLSHNVADSVEAPRAKRIEMQSWDENEVNCFLEAAKPSPYYALFYLALFTGMRRSELLALRWQDTDLLFGQISVSRGLHCLKDGTCIFTEPKSAKSRRTIALPPSVISLLREQKAKQEFDHKMLGIPSRDSDLIFSTAEGRPLLPNSVTHAWIKLVRRAGLKYIRLHDCRHSHASLLLKQGIHPKIVQERLGHSSIQITLDTYSHVAPGLQEAAAQKFDDLLKVGHNEAAKKELVAN